MIQIDPKKSSIRDVYHLMISAISPRPIAFVGSVNNLDEHNLAPYSFFNGFGANPPIVGFSPANSGRTGLPKDTLLNIEETKEFTISIVTKDIVNQVSLSSCEFSRNVDEFEKTGLTKFKSQIISPYGVKESPIIMECKLYEIIKLGNLPASGNLILGEIIFFHIDEKVLDEKNKINSKEINHIGRSGGNFYTESKNSFFEIHKPNCLGVGFDKLPADLLQSSLRGDELAKLASVEYIPELILNESLACHSLKEVISEISSSLKKDDVQKSWQIFLNWENNSNV
tara:strand:+ start:138 stop:989 length:852 start_codon:yes stop_codon:yes gene_type:complete